jgi:hypothetical protein
MRAVIALLGSLFVADKASLRAQTTSASVSGQVKDAQGGVLPGATVTLTSRTQGNVATATTDAEGRFVFPIVRADAYNLKVTMQGFKTLERTGVAVNANDKLSVGVISLQVGEMTEEISVTGVAPELQNTSGERSFTVEGATISKIANNGRSAFGFLQLVPGVSPDNGSENIANVSSFSANGMRDSMNNVTFDGVANIDTGNNGGNMATTNLDAVAEFKVLTNGYQAEYGRAAGAQVQLITKSGSQEFHGSGYWYGRRSDWNANSWTNLRGPGPTIEPPDASRNQYGYTIGGPIYIPGAFNVEKKKLFFFWSQEWQKQNDPASQQLSRVPTALERTGDFSQSVDASGNPFPYVRDYTTGLPCGPTDTRGCFQAGGVLGRIPQSRLYGPGLAALNIYPLPNFAGGSGINYQSQVPNNTPRKEELLRIDFQVTDNWRVTGRYMHDDDTQFLPYGTTWAGAGSNNLDTVQTTFATPGRNWLVSTTGVINATTSLEVSVGSAHNSLDFNIGNPNLRRTAAGLSGMPLLYPSAVQQDYIPDMRFNGGNVGGNAGYFQTNNGPFTNQNTTYDALANLSKVWGRHTAKFGVYYQSSWKPQSPFTSFNSQISFIDDSNNPYDTQFGYANAATGVFDTYQQASTYNLPEWVYKNFEWYAQDNWKATRRLTLDYGVRFYVLTPQWDQTLSASTFLPNQFNAAGAATLYEPGFVNGQRVGIDPTTGQTVDQRFIGRLTPESNAFNGAFQAGQGVNDQMQSGNAFRVSPRFGFVYDVSGDGSMIVRGGAGLFYDRPMGNMVFNQIANAPGTLQPTLQWGLLQNLTAAGGDPRPTLGMSPTAFDFAPPKVYSWNVGVQRKLGRGFTFDIAYVGSLSKNTLSQENINAVPLGADFQTKNQDPTKPGTALPDDFLRPYQGYGAITLWGYKAYSNYNSLQTQIQRRFQNGLMVSVFYVWSKSLGTNDNDYSAVRPNATYAEDRAANYSYVGNDRPQTFVANVIYQTPKIARGVLGVIANDWQISGVYRLLSGTPYPINFSIPGISNANLTGSNDYGARVVVTCNPGSGSSSDPYRQINTACFAPPQAGSTGLESARYFLHGPGLNNLDMSLSKMFSVGKQVKMEVRLDAFNALNHTQYTGVNNTVNFKSLSDPTITNLPYDANGNLVNPNGFGTVNGVRAPRTLQLVTRLTF